MLGSNCVILYYEDTSTFPETIFISSCDQVSAAFSGMKSAFWKADAPHILTQCDSFKLWLA